MDEERELIEARRWYFKKRIEETIKAIQRNNMEAIYVEDRRAALEEILRSIPEGAIVTHGGSYTIRELGIVEILEKGNYRYLQQEIRGDDTVQYELQIKGFSSDVYLTSVNAITIQGELMALDGFGNRAACLLFGPKKVLVVAGKNKIVDTLEEGIKRIKDYVAPVHARRRNWDLPCTQAGKCMDCNSERRICNKLAILQYERNKDRTSVILVGEDLGI